MAGWFSYVYGGVMKPSQMQFRRGKGPTPRQLARGGASHLATATATKTIERTAPTDQPVEDALGHWRNRWHVPEKHSQLARRQGALPLGDGTWLGYRRFPTSNAAEQEALRVAEYNFLMFGISYIGPEFFPEY
jgi:hypothetical protein